MKILIILFLLLYNYNSNAQNLYLQYDIVLESHVESNNLPEVDSLYYSCGYFNISDTLIIREQDKYQIVFKTLDLDCQSYYYFAKDNYLIVENKDAGYILISQLNLEKLYIKTYYLKRN